MSLAKKTIKNSVFSIAAFAVPTLLSFVATPYIVRGLGQQQYGILALVASFVGFFAVLDFGVSPALIKYVSELTAKKNYSRLNKIFTSALTFYTLIGLFGAGIIVFAGFHFLDFLIKDLQPAQIPTVRLVFFITAFGFLINMILSALSALPTALQRLEITSKINMGVAIVASLGAVILIKFGFGVVAISSLSIVNTLAALVIYLIINKRLIPSLKLHFGIDRKSLKTIFGFSGYAFLTMVSSMFISQFDRVYLGVTLGATAVTYYVIPGNITVKILGFVVATNSIIFPLTSSLLAENKIMQLHTVYKRATRVIITLLVIGIVPMIVFSNKFLLYWLGPEYAANSTIILQVLLVTYGISSLHVIPFLTAYGAGKPKLNALYAASGAISNVVLMFIFIPIFGLNGVAYAYLAAVIIPTFIFIRYIEKNLLKINNREFYTRLIIKTLILIIITLLTSLCFVGLISSLKLFILIYGLTLFISACLFWLLRLVEQDDIELIKFIFLEPLKRMMSRK